MKETFRITLPHDALLPICHQSGVADKMGNGEFTFLLRNESIGLEMTSAISNFERLP